MRILLTILLFTLSSLSHSYEKFPEKVSCMDITEGGEHQHAEADAWIRGYLAGRKNAEVFRKESDNFVSKVFSLCLSDAELYLDNAANAVFVTGGFE